MLKISALALLVTLALSAAEMKLDPIERSDVIAVRANATPQRCGKYFFTWPAVDQHGRIFNYKTSTPTVDWTGIAEHDQFRIVIDLKKESPTVELVKDPKSPDGNAVILRINQKDYDEAKSCLPPPLPK